MIESIGELYADESRATSPEVDFGVHWRDAPEPVGVRSRVSYLLTTGELYRHSLDGSGDVEILAKFPVEPCRTCRGDRRGCDVCLHTGVSRDQVEQVLEGWELHAEGPYGVGWLRRRLAGWAVRAA